MPGKISTMYQLLGGSRKAEGLPGLETFVLVVLHLERADDDVAIVKSHVLAGEVGVVKARHAVMVVHEVMVKFAVGVVPQLVVRGNDRLVVVEDLKRLGIDRLQYAIERTADPFLHGMRDVIVEGHPHESAKRDLAA